MSNVWPAFQTYTWTGNKEIAAALTTLFSKDGDGKTRRRRSWSRYRRMPNDKPGAEANDHGVHFLESTTPWALGYLWTGNREFLDATLGLARPARHAADAALRACPSPTSITGRPARFGEPRPATWPATCGARSSS